MKKIISIIMALMLLSGQAVLASDTTYEKAYFDVVSLGIFKGDENGDLRLGDALTRAEFAAIMTRVLRSEDMAVAFKDVAAIFTDVRQDDWFCGYIGAVCANGLMRGVSDNQFDPYSNVTYEQAVKTLVATLGYTTVAEKKGGYPTGYMAEGIRLGLTKNVPNESPLTRESVMKLIYNALDVDMLVMEFGGKGGYYIEEGKTLRNMYLAPSSDVQIIKSEGIITANNDTYLNSANASLEKDEVEIDDVRFRVGNTNAYDFIGQRVEYYAMDDGGRKTLISVRTARNTEIINIDVTNLTSATLSEVTYKENGKKQTSNISGAKIVYNGRLVLVPNNSDLDIRRGDLKLIDNDDDNMADVVFVTDWETVRVKEVKNNTVEFESGSSFDGSRFLHIDIEDEDEEIHYLLKNSEGKAITPSEIAPDSILSISADKNRKFYTIVCAVNTKEGTVTAIGDEDIELDGEVISVYEGDTFAFEAGDGITAYLDFKGNIVDFEEKEEMLSYAYILAAASKGAIGNNFQVKMVVGSLVDFQYDKNEEDLDDANLIPTVICKNSEIGIYDIADRVIVDGNVKKSVSEKTTSIVSGLYLYELNSDGEIKELTSASHFGGGTNMTYNPYDKTFAKNSRRTPFAIDKDTVVICLPTNGDAEDDDYFVPLKIKNSGSSTFTATGYDFDTDTKKVKALIFMEKMKKTDALTATESSSVGMVAKSIMTKDENGNFVPKISIATKSGLTEYTVNEVPGQNDVLNTLRVGDLINYEVDLSGMLSNARIIRSFADGSSAFDDLTEVYGNITDVSFDEIHLSSGNLVATVTADTAKGVSTVDITQRNVPPIFIYDSEQKTVEIGAISDIYPRGSEIFYALKPAENQGVAKVCVIYR